MKFGAHSMMFEPAVTIESLNMFDRAKRHGLDGIELVIADPDSFPTQAVVEKKNETHLDVTFGVMLQQQNDVSSADATIRRRGIEHLKKCVDLVAGMGGTMLGGVLYSAFNYFSGNMRTREEWQRSAEALANVAQYAKPKGMSLSLEPVMRFRSYFLNTTEDGCRLVDEIGEPNVGLLLDTFHMNMEDKSIPEAIRMAGHRLFEMHVNENDRGVPGTGHVPWDEVFRALAQIDFDGWAVMESFVPEMNEVARLTSTWRKSAPSSDVIIAEGLPFFKILEERHRKAKPAGG